jgi:hypothetical protein
VVFGGNHQSRRDTQQQLILNESSRNNGNSAEISPRERTYLAANKSNQM